MTYIAIVSLNVQCRRLTVKLSGEFWPFLVEDSFNILKANKSTCILSDLNRLERSLFDNGGSLIRMLELFKENCKSILAMLLPIAWLTEKTFGFERVAKKSF